MYRPPSTSLPTDVIVGDTSFTGLHADMPRRRRLFWAGSLIASRQVLIGVVDTGRNRLLIGQGESEAVLRQILASVGLSEDASVIGTAGESEISEVD